jgi:hypothetical protein
MTSEIKTITAKMLSGELITFDVKTEEFCQRYLETYVI